MNICVYGASSALLKNIYYEKTEELGRAMGKRGHGLVFGGGATGMMGAAARGVAAENGYILGIAPRFFDQPGVLYEKCTEFIFTENMRERKKLLEEKSDATIVAPGGIGTYEEFFEIFTLKSLKRIDRPIVLYNIDGYYDKMKALLEYTAEEKFMDFSVLDLVVFLDEPTAVLDYLENYKKYGCEVIRHRTRHIAEAARPDRCFVCFKQNNNSYRFMTTSSSVLFGTW